MISRPLLERFAWRLPEGLAGLYASVSMGSAMVLGLWLLWHDIGWLSLLVPALSFGLVVGRYHLFGAALPVLLCTLLARVPDFGPVFVTHPFGPSETIVCILGLTLIASCLRYLTLVNPSAAEPSAVIPFEALSDNRRTISIEFLVLMATIVGAFIAARLWFLLLDTDYMAAVSGFGLLPEGLLAIKLALSIFVVFLIVHSTMSYWQWRRMGRLEATMRLQHQIWQWCGHEQKIVARVQGKLRKD